MAKIFTKNTASTFDKSASSKNSTQMKNATVFERTITTEVKGIKTILSNNEKVINEIKKTLITISKKPFSNGFEKDKSDLYGATEEHEDKKKQAATMEVNNSIKALHKDLLGVLGLKGESTKTSEGNFFTRLLKKIFSLDTLLKGALAALPFVFSNTLKALLGKGLEKLGVDKEIAAKAAHYLVPAIQGAGIGYLLFRGWKGIVAGAVVGVGYTMIQDMVDEWKDKTKDKSRDNIRQIQGLGNLTEGVLIGAGVGFATAGIKGMIAGAVIGAGVASVTNLITQWNQNVNHPEEKTTAQHFANLGEGAFYGAITGGIIGSAFGPAGLAIGIAAGAIVGGSAGLISSMISDWRAKNSKAENYQLKSETFKAAQEGTLNPTAEEIKKDKEELEKLINDSRLPNQTEEQLKEANQKILELKTDIATKQHVLDENKKLEEAKKTGKASHEWYTTKDGKLVDLQAEQNVGRRFWTWLTNKNEGYSYLEKEALKQKFKREGLYSDLGDIKQDYAIQAYVEKLSNIELERKRKEYRAQRILSAEIPGTNLTYGSEGNQILWKSDYNRELETINAGKNYSIEKSEEQKQKQHFLDQMDKEKMSYFNYANSEIDKLDQIIELLKGVNNPYPQSAAEQVSQSIIRKIQNYG